MRFCDYPDRLAPFFNHFPAENMMFIDFKEFVESPEAVIRRVLDFLGLEQQHFQYQQLPAGMKTDYGNRTLQPTAAHILRNHFQDSGRRLEELTQQSFSWVAPEQSGLQPGSKKENK
ncbi:hypothetical protein WJX84_003230 [Apatococcus fuscideae]|uniref:Sulfotransferase n=1 Tax=Apatococcus fuscideae TaxID=2026836 RepID=A0AAW1T4E2_9CHLO